MITTPAPSFKRRGKSLLPGWCSLEEMADQARNDGFGLLLLLKMSGTAWEKIEQRIQKRDEGRVTGDEKNRNAINRIPTPLHHFTTYFLPALIFCYFCIRTKYQKRKN
jgi:hypothetical protein